MMHTRAEPSVELAHAALFVDFENIYYFIKNRAPDSVDAAEASINTLLALRTSLVNERGKDCIVQHAYADFEKIGGSAQGSLYLMGVETHNVLGTEHKNAADMRLCIDAMETLYTRKEIGTFVFVAGDRDYIPVVQHLRKHAKTMLVAAFRDSLSGDLLQVVDERNFIDASAMLPAGAFQTPNAPRPNTPLPAKLVGAATKRSEPKQVGKFEKPSDLVEDERHALGIMLNNFKDKPEIWMTPFLHKLRAETPNLADYERKALITSLSGKGAIAIEKRQGDPSDYSVIIVNWDHPDARALNPGL